MGAAEIDRASRSAGIAGGVQIVWEVAEPGDQGETIGRAIERKITYFNARQRLTTNRAHYDVITPSGPLPDNCRATASIFIRASAGLFW